MARQFNSKRLNEYIDAYIKYEIAVHGIDPRETLEGSLFKDLSNAGEGYKYNIYAKYHSSLIAGKPFTEPHHLVPLAFSDRFDGSLDREENIVSLCSNCHNEIHYGKEAGKLVKKLYGDRKDLLESIGISITLDELLEMYGIV